MPRRFLLPLALLALAGLVPPAAADPAAPLPPSASLRSDILYTHKGEFVQVAPMRALTLNAHVEQFAYDPLGIELAYVGSEPQGENTVHFVKTVDARTGHTMSQLTLVASQAGWDAGYFLMGWSVSGKYLLLKRFQPDPQAPDTSLVEFLRWNLSADPPAARTIDPAAALPPEQHAEPGTADGFLSPDGRWLVFSQRFYTLTADGKPGPGHTAYLLYDPERDTFRPLSALPPDVSGHSWADATHFKFWQQDARKQIDVVTNKISLVKSPLDAAAPAVSKQYPDLSLDVEPRLLRDEAVKGSGGHLEAEIVWVRRTPLGTMPLGAAPAGVMPSRHDSFNPQEDDPQEKWAPTGKQLAFIANRDLYVTDLTAPVDLLPQEKLAVGLKLSCEEERQLAQSNLQQIGLALIQYVQDNDEKFPVTAGIEKALAPYLKTQDVFSVGGTHWVYRGASGVSLAAIESPAETVQATMDLPCARVVLFCDGHVKVFPK